MEAKLESLYLELRIIRNELVEILMNNTCSIITKPFIEEELKDIENALQKIERNEFGLCESTGEKLPNEYLQMIPTLKTLEDMSHVERYFCKPIYS